MTPNTLFVVALAIFVIALLVAVLGYIFKWPWAGVTYYQPPAETERRGVTLWGWLTLLVMPLTVVVIASYLAYFQQQSASKAQQVQQEIALEVQSKQAKDALEVQSEQAKDEALRAYFDQMSELMLDHDLRTSEEDSPQRDLARARTLTVVKRQGSGSKGDIVNFLYEANLIKRDPTIISLVAAHLEEVQLDRTNLEEVNLYWTYLHKAKFCWAVLRSSNLKLSDLSEADLRIADLSGADLRIADLGGTHLSGADLSGADLRKATNITQEQIEAAMGDQKTQLPDHPRLERPDHWSLPISKQKERLHPIKPSECE